MSTVPDVGGERLLSDETLLIQLSHLGDIPRSEDLIAAVAFQHQFSTMVQQMRGSIVRNS